MISFIINIVLRIFVSKPTVASEIDINTVNSEVDTGYQIWLNKSQFAGCNDIIVNKVLINPLVYSFEPFTVTNAPALEIANICLWMSFTWFVLCEYELMLEFSNSILDYNVNDCKNFLFGVKLPTEIEEILLPGVEGPVNKAEGLRENIWTCYKCGQSECTCEPGLGGFLWRNRYRIPVMILGVSIIKNSFDLYEIVSH